jgi:hypothetical protein
MSILANWLTKLLTLPDLWTAILSRLTAWQAQAEVLPLPAYNWPGVNDIVWKQDRVGWRVFLEGGVLQDWAAKQQEYFEWLNKRNTGKRWITTLIKKLWQISWTMWDHRNKESKNPESPDPLQAHNRLDALITQQYKDLSTLATRDRRWFRRPKEVLFTEPIEYKQQWLESVLLARARYT